MNSSNVGERLRRKHLHLGPHGSLDDVASCFIADFDAERLSALCREYIARHIGQSLCRLRAGGIKPAEDYPLLVRNDAVVGAGVEEISGHGR